MEPLLLGPGKHRVSKDEYLNDPCLSPSLSSSIASLLITRSPKHAYHAHPRLGRGGSGEYTEATSRGTAIDSLLLGGDTEIVPIDVEDFRSKDARAQRDAAYAAGKLPMKLAEYQEYKLKADAIRSRLQKHGIALDGENQVTIVWEEATPTGPILARCRIDHLKVFDDRAIICDLKTTKCAHPKEVATSMVKWGYDIQAAAYKRAVGKLYPHLVGRIDFVFLFVETEAPYECLPAEPDGQMQKRGEYGWAQAVALWGKCLHEHEWPGYIAPGEIARITPPAWAQIDTMPEGGSPGVSF